MLPVIPAQDTVDNNAMVRTRRAAIISDLSFKKLKTSEEDQLSCYDMQFKWEFCPFCDFRNFQKVSFCVAKPGIVSLDFKFITLCH